MAMAAFVFAEKYPISRRKVLARKPKFVRLVATMLSSANHKLLRVLGLDPAAAGATGYAVLDSDGKYHQVVRYGALRVPRVRQKESPGAVLQEIHELVGELVKQFAPTVIAVESVFTALNMRTALRLAEVRGVVLLAAAQHR